MQQLLADTGRLSPIPAAAAEAYDARKGLLAERVNLTLMARPYLTDLIGMTAGVEMMQDNHRNHAMFLTTVLHLSAFRLLASVLPWVYRTYQQHGFSHAYFPVELNAWKQAIQKELEPDTAAAILPVYDWMLEHHDAVLRIADELSVPPEQALPDETETFLDTLLTQDLPHVIEFGEKSLQPLCDPGAFYQNTLQPAMYELGNRWERGEVTVAEEHLATATAQAVVATLQGKAVLSPKTRGRALVSAAVGELHELGARMISHCLEADGWDVTFLGANVPMNDLIGMARRIRPRFIGISVSMPYHLHHVKRLIDSLAADSDLNKIPLLIGGQVFAMFPEAAACLPGAKIVTTCTETVELARGLGIG